MYYFYLLFVTSSLSNLSLLVFDCFSISKLPLCHLFCFTYIHICRCHFYDIISFFFFLIAFLPNKTKRFTYNLLLSFAIIHFVCERHSSKIENDPSSPHFLASFPPSWFSISFLFSLSAGRQTIRLVTLPQALWLDLFFFFLYFLLLLSLFLSFLLIRRYCHSRTKLPSDRIDQMIRKRSIVRWYYGLCKVAFFLLQNKSINVWIDR